MCVAVPGRILSIGQEQMAVVDFGGVSREISVAFLDSPVVDDYVIVHAGFALHKISAEEAEVTLSLIRQVLDAEIS